DGEANTNIDMRNNVIYNWGFNSIHGGERATVNIVNNYFKPGPATRTGDVSRRIAQPSHTTDAVGNRLYGQWYIAGNFVDGSPTVTSDNWNGGVQPSGGTGDIPLLRSMTQFPIATAYPVTTQTAQVAYNHVLASAGSSLVRDSVDTRIINEITNRTATHGGVYGANSGIIDSQMTVGGWPVLNSQPAPLDSDNDGMPDAWEIARGLNPLNAADRNHDRNGDGYTNLEEYINSLSPDPFSRDITPPTPDPMTWAVTPHALNATTISMTATTASDPSGVEYYFANITDPSHDSGWQDSPTFIDTGLSAGINYTYTVRARDKSAFRNATAPSSPAAAPSFDTTPPNPSPMTWAVEPHAAGATVITMTATTALDVSGVEYYFANITDPSHDSGWQDSPTFIDTGLVNNAAYSYRVIARDKSISRNETLWSEEAVAATLQFDCTETISADLDGDCRVGLLDYAILAQMWLEPLPLTNDLITNGAFDTDLSGWQSLNLPTAAGVCYSGWDDSPYGNPPGSAYLMCDMWPGDASGHFFYQIIPVTPGQRYRFSGEWSGDLSSFAMNPSGISNHAKVAITFESGTDPAAWGWTEPAAVMYRKSWGIDSQNISPDGIWDWEPITASIANGPSDGIFTATDQYMIVAFTMSGISSNTVPWFSFDNIMVEGPGCPPLDLNGDCSLDFLDLHLFAEDWLKCNRFPAGECLAL
ncbi:MAG TPA: hypothetical protein VLH60_04685, partial [Sedimentisphaerales bacterium]|nr:hypothetical protein [Sedimentisphaerales bacterium]